METDAYKNRSAFREYEKEPGRECRERRLSSTHTIEISASVKCAVGASF